MKFSSVRKQPTPGSYWKPSPAAESLMNKKRYYIVTSLMALLLSPIAVSIGVIGGAVLIDSVPIGFALVIVILSPILTTGLVWVLYAKKATLPEKASEVFLPIFLVFCYYICVWITIFGLSNYRFGGRFFNDAYFLLTIPYYLINVFFSFGGDFGLFPVVNATTTVITVLFIIITCAICKKKLIFDRIIIIYISGFVCLSGIATFQHFDRNTKILSYDYNVERIEDEVNFYDYRPFRENNMLKRLNEAAVISFNENYPKLDGATAAYPVYGAMAQELYKGLDRNTVDEYVACSKTDVAYERLIRGEIDIFFGAQPSKQQIEAAKEKGIEFVLTPIAKEAFVFFVNKKNPVNSLTLEQIQDIYQKNITNWNSVGGNDEKITPFQRPDNSGSQTIMLAMIMRDKILPPPLWEEYAAGMGGVISKVAAYRNYSSAIGYSFRYFATGMKPDENIKLLTISEIEPTIENIRKDIYPFTIDVYAVTAGSVNENTEKLIEWILSEQGQSFIEICGYVRK